MVLSVALGAVAPFGAWAAPVASAIPGYEACAPGDTHRIDVRGVSCEYAATVVSAYQWEGDKYQEIYEFTCYTAQYDVRPVVLTCVAGEQEIVVSEL